MNHCDHRLAVWPSVVAIACVLLVTACQDGSGPSLVTSPEGRPAYEGAKPPPPPPPPPANPAIAFKAEGRVRGNGGGWVTAHFLKVMNADGSNVTTIYTSVIGPGYGGIINRPSWSPDGRSVAFQNDGVRLIDVSVVNGVPTGTNARLLVSEPAGQPAWAPQGDLIAYVNSTAHTLEVVPATGGVPQVLYSSLSSLWSPSWSPDARRIAFLEGDGATSHTIRVLDRNDMTVTTVLGPEGGPWNPIWARTQDVLAFTDASGNIYTIQLPSGTPTLVRAGSMPDWSSDDRDIVFGGGGSLYKVDLATGSTTLLTSGGMYPGWRR